MSIKSTMARLGAALSGVLILGSASTSWAIPTVFISQAAWLTALPPGVILQIDNFATDTLGDVISGTNLGLFTVTHDATDNLPEIASLFDASRKFVGDISSTAVGGRATFIDFTFNTPLIGLAGDYFSTSTAEMLLVTLNGTIINFNTNLGGPPGDGFLGLIDLMNPIASIRYTVLGNAESNELWGVDNFLLASASIPEPGTLALFGLGLAGLGFSARRRKAA